MLSYLHGFHAGNHADVLKHVVLLALLDALASKPKALRYVETHAGAGGYDLGSSAAQQNRENESGIAKVWQATSPPPAVARLLDLVREYNGADAALGRYPGSPWLAQRCLRDGDSAYLFELHPTEHRALSARFANDRRIHVLRRDGLAEMVGLVPPPERRALVFVDPAYEIAGEPLRVVDALAKAHRRFATGVYALWYPVIERRTVNTLEKRCRAADLEPLTVFELAVAPDRNGRGMTGSGVIVVNPPWRVRERIESALPWLATVLAGERGRHRVVAIG